MLSWFKRKKDRATQSKSPSSTNPATGGWSMDPLNPLNPFSIISPLNPINGACGPEPSHIHHDAPRCDATSGSGFSSDSGGGGVSSDGGCGSVGSDSGGGF